jgi:hypothetical protein
MSQEWNDALLATAKRMDVKAIEKAQKKARVVLRREAKLKRDPLKDALKLLSDNLKRDIIASNTRIEAEFADLRQWEADCNVLAFFIAAHDKRGGAQ